VLEHMYSNGLTEKFSFFQHLRCDSAPMPTLYREEPCKSALNRVQGMPFAWSLNPYMGCAHQCTFCYVRGFERRADRPSDGRYGSSIRVKVNVAQVLRAEVTRRGWKREGIALGAATDPYQPAEGKYRLTRGCLQVLSCVHNPFSIVTRGPMIVRDIDVLQEASRRASVQVNFSVPTLDVDIWRRTEPGTAPPRQRLRALKTLVDAGVRAGVGMAPLLPGLSDKPELLREVVLAAREAGAAFLWANVLYLKPGTREHFLENLARDWPEMLDRYQQLYSRPFAPKAASEPIIERVARIRAEYDFAEEHHSHEEVRPNPGQMALFET
jgi:DNA repair photolyase